MISLSGYSPRLSRFASSANLSEEECENIRYVEDALDQLGAQCSHLRSAVRLFEFAAAKGFSEGASEWDGWAAIACRDAVNTVYVFHESLEALGINLNRCPALLERIDSRARRLVTKTFANHFPDFEGLRHSAGHAGQLYGTPEAASEHRLPGIGSLYVHNIHFSTARFETTFKGRLVSLHLNAQTAAKLEKVRDRCWALFRPIEALRLPPS